MSGQPVKLEIRGAIALVSLNRPAQRNAVDKALSAALSATFDRIEADDAIRVSILRGEGPVFCAGLDLGVLAEGGGMEDILFGKGGFGGFVSRVRQKPVIAAVHGAAFAGGFELMLACDLVVAAGSCRFGLPESLRGLVAGGGGAFRLGQILPRAVANEILLLGAPFDANRAYELGLVNRVVDQEELLSTAASMAETIVANAPLSIGASMALARAGESGRDDTLWSQNDRYLKQLLASADAQEGASAFKQRRPAQWTGR